MSRSQEGLAAAAEVDAQIAEVRLMEAEGRTPTTVDETYKQAEDILKAKKAGVDAQNRIDAAYNKSIDAGRRIGSRVKTGAYDANRWLANVPTPGGVWAAFWVLIFLFMVLFPVNGHTRIMWLWMVLWGKAAIPSLGQSGSATQGWGAAVQSAINSATPQGGSGGNSGTGSTTPGGSNSPPVSTPPGGSNAITGNINISGNPIGTGIDTGNIFQNLLNGMNGSNLLEILNGQ